jgi:hypothetical protein
VNLVSCLVVGCFFAVAGLAVRFFNRRLWIIIVVNLAAILLNVLIGSERVIEALFERDDLLGRFLWDVYLGWSVLGAIVAAIATFLLTSTSGVSDAVILASFVCVAVVVMHLSGILATVIREESCRRKVLLWQGRYREPKQATRSYDEGWELD